MKKITLLLALILTVSIGAYSQLSTREVSSVSVPLGNRPQAGDAALQFVFPILNMSANDGTEAGLYSGNFFGSGDMLTFKYYNTEDIVYRAAIRIYADNKNNKGNELDSTDNYPFPQSDIISEFDERSASREFNIAGGIEKHFSNTNFFDVYVGGEALIGLGKDASDNNYTFANGDYSKVKTTTNTNILGVAGVVGFNMFVAELPVSIGLEYGLSGKWIFGGPTKVVSETKFGSGSANSNEYYSQADDLFGRNRSYSKLKTRQFNMETNNNIRLNIHIYFSTFRK